MARGWEIILYRPRGLLGIDRGLHRNHVADPSSPERARSGRRNRGSAGRLNAFEYQKTALDQ